MPASAPCSHQTLRQKMRALPALMPALMIRVRVLPAPSFPGTRVGHTRKQAQRDAAPSAPHRLSRALPDGPHFLLGAMGRGNGLFAHAARTGHHRGGQLVEYLARGRRSRDGELASLGADEVAIALSLRPAASLPPASAAPCLENSQDSACGKPSLASRASSADAKRPICQPWPRQNWCLATVCPPFLRVGLRLQRLIMLLVKETPPDAAEQAPHRPAMLLGHRQPERYASSQTAGVRRAEIPRCSSSRIVSAISS